jgi:hypothetical protein
LIRERSGISGLVQAFFLNEFHAIAQNRPIWRNGGYSGGGLVFAGWFFEN